MLQLDNHYVEEAPLAVVSSGPGQSGESQLQLMTLPSSLQQKRKSQQSLSIQGID